MQASDIDDVFQVRFEDAKSRTSPNSAQKLSQIEHSPSHWHMNISRPVRLFL